MLLNSDDMGSSRDIRASYRAHTRILSKPSLFFGFRRDIMLCISLQNWLLWGGGDTFFNFPPLNFFLVTTMTIDLFQITRTFLATLEVEDTGPAVKLIYQNFFDGYDSKQVQLSSYEDELWSKIKNSLKINYNWTEKVRFIRLSSQNCSEMLVFTGYF